MGKFSFISIGVLGLLLIGCTDNKAQTEQLAKIQARLDEQERQNHLLQAQVKEKEEQRMREEELRKANTQTQDGQSVKNTQANDKANQPTVPTNKPFNTSNQPNSPKPTQTTKSDTKPATVKFNEKPARYPATVVTSSGYGALSLRGEPSVKGIQVASVYDGEEVQVIAETNRCEVIGGIRGCWYKVDIGEVKGYMFSGYLQRELISQVEKQSFYQNHEPDEEDIIY